MTPDLPWRAVALLVLYAFAGWTIVGGVLGFVAVYASLRAFENSGRRPGSWSARSGLYLLAVPIGGSPGLLSGISLSAA